MSDDREDAGKKITDVKRYSELVEENDQGSEGLPTAAIVEEVWNTPDIKKISVEYSSNSGKLKTGDELVRRADVETLIQDKLAVLEKYAEGQPDDRIQSRQIKAINTLQELLDEVQQNP